MLSRLTETDFELMKELAAGLMSVEQIATVLGVDANELLQLASVPGNRVHKEIEGTYLLQEAKVRKSIFDMAQRGSSPAQAAALHIIRELEQKKILGK